MTPARPPFVSCICVTKNRRLFLRRAVEQFQRGRYIYNVRGGDAELVIVDSSPAPADAAWRDFDFVRYLHLPCDTPKVGHVHNVACEAARGRIIIQWDDDDWHGPYRIARQVQSLESAGPEGFTFSSAYYWYHVTSRRACKARTWTEGGACCGALFAYHRATWRALPFRDVERAEDTYFWMDHAARGGRTIFADANDPSIAIYIRHNVNASRLTNYDFTDEATQAARALMGADVSFYDELAEVLPLATWNQANGSAAKVHALTPLQQLHVRHYR